MCKATTPSPHSQKIHFSLQAFLLLLLLFSLKMSVQAAKTVEEAFTKDDLVEDVVPEAPTKIAKVNFGGDIQAQLGNMLMPAKAKHRPEVSWEAEGSKLYTLAMVDPDAPSRKKAQAHREWIHWLVINVPGHRIGKGNTLIDYSGPAPPKGSGPHRYVILVYQQDGKIPVDQKPDGRANFDINQFAHQNRFERPIAGNYFTSEQE